MLEQLDWDLCAVVAAFGPKRAPGPAFCSSSTMRAAVTYEAAPSNAIPSMTVSSHLTHTTGWAYLPRNSTLLSALLHLLHLLHELHRVKAKRQRWETPVIVTGGWRVIAVTTCSWLFDAGGLWAAHPTLVSCNTSTHGYGKKMY
jgi:hypothetical protein